MACTSGKSTPNTWRRMCFLLIVSSATAFAPARRFSCSNRKPLSHDVLISDNRRQPSRKCRPRTGDSSSSGDRSSPDYALGDCARDYVSILRPATILQAVGALVVGHLTLQPKRSIPTLMTPSILFAALSVYLSYGAGMVMNDVVDAAIDAGGRQNQIATDGGDKLKLSKADRPLASGRISRQAGWTYCFVLSASALWLAGCASATVAFASAAGAISYRFVWWTAGNMAIMLGYALGLQCILLIKNILCGWLAISPLIGAACLVAEGCTGVLSGSGFSSLLAPDLPVVSKLYLLAAVGFPMQVAREILKDAEDVDIDQGNKITLPMVIGTPASKRLAYNLVASVIMMMVLTPYYWKIFYSHPPVYLIGVLFGFPMCIWASKLQLREGHQLLKKSMHVLLASMIGALLLQR